MAREVTHASRRHRLFEQFSVHMGTTPQKLPARMNEWLQKNVRISFHGQTQAIVKIARKITSGQEKEAKSCVCWDASLSGLWKKQNKKLTWLLFVGSFSDVITILPVDVPRLHLSGHKFADVGA